MKARSATPEEPDIWLPFPNAKEVEAFRVLYRRQFGVELTLDEATDVATRLVHIRYVFYRASRSDNTNEQAVNPHS